MPYRVYEVRFKDSARLEEALHDDIVSRQSVVLRTAEHFGLARETLFVFVEGQEAGLMRADALILEFGRRSGVADELHRRLKAEEDAAASALGSILGNEP